MFSRFAYRRKNDLKKIARWIRSVGASWQQARLARQMALATTRKLVLFMTSSIDDCNGGIMSIASIAATTRKLFPDMRVFLSTYPGNPTIARNNTFPNEEPIVRLSLIRRLTCPQKLVLHIPEMDADSFYDMLSSRDRAWIRAIPDCQINILNQNIDYMRPKALWTKLFDLTTNVTQTTAHTRYSTQEVCNRYEIPLHRFGVYIDSSGWPFKRFEQKRKVIVVSPDNNEYKPAVLEMIASQLPDYRVIEVNNMTFSAYLELIASAPFVVTFGEGEDGYFIQPLCVGSLGFAVYNDRFFSRPELKNLANVYSSFEELVERFPEDVRKYEQDLAAYESARQCHLAMLSPFPYERFCDNLRRFYARQYDFLPQ